MVSRRQFLFSLVALPLFPQLLTATTVDKPLRWAQISDSHLVMGGRDNSRRLFHDSPALLESMLEEVADAGVEFAILTGDIIDGARPRDWELFRRMIAKFPRPIHLLPGNHDLAVGKGISRSHFNDFRPGAPLFKERIPTHFSPRPEVTFVLLDGVDNNRITANGLYGPAQLEWLEWILIREEKAGRRIFLFSHYPLLEPFKSRSHCLDASEARLLRALLQRHPAVGFYISGHYHCCKIARQDHCTHISTPALVEYPNAARIFEWRGDRLWTALLPTPLAPLVEKSRNRCPSHALNLGTPADRDGLFPISPWEIAKDKPQGRCPAG